MNSDLRDKHLLVFLFIFLCLILLASGSFSGGWDKILDWSLDKAALILGGILTLLVQRAAGALDRTGDPTKRSTVESTTTETTKVSTPPMDAPKIPETTPQDPINVALVPPKEDK